MNALRLALTCLLVLSLPVCKSPTPKPGANERIISLTPSLTYIVFALGSDAQLVGRDKYSTRPPKAELLPVVGDFLHTNIEALVALAPDLVLHDSQQQKTASALDQLSIAHRGFDMHSLQDVRNAVQSLGIVLGREERAATITNKMDAARTTYKLKKGVRALVLLDRDPEALRGIVAAGKGSFHDELLQILGAQNVLADSALPYPKISAESLLALAPEFILDLSQAKSLSPYAQLPSLPAQANGRIVLARNPELLAPGPDLDAALAILLGLIEHGAKSL